MHDFYLLIGFAAFAVLGLFAVGKAGDFIVKSCKSMRKDMSGKQENHNKKLH